MISTGGDEYWFVGDDLAAVSTPVRSSVHFSICRVFVCGLCGDAWARRMLLNQGLPQRWGADTWNECPKCKPVHRKGRLKLITYEEAELLEFKTVPTAILALEFLWLYLAEFPVE